MYACYQYCLLTDTIYCLISFQTLCSEFEDDSCSALCQAVTRHVQEAETAQDSNNGNWWKIHEACMLALGSAKSVVVRKLEGGEVVFDLTGFLQNVVITDMNSSGQCFCSCVACYMGSVYINYLYDTIIPISIVMVGLVEV